nr:MAG TPA: hypothetical protein [Caudoviricetes sp.]
MQTSKYEIGANLQGLEFRRQANKILAALASSNAGDLEPASAQAGTVWLDTSNDKRHLLKIRNKANSAWGILCSIDAQSGVVDTIDAYTKKESEKKFALKDDLPPLATETKEGIVKLKNSITGNLVDAAVSENAAKEYMDKNASIGIGQTLQNLKNERRNGEIYTNKTGRPIFIFVSQQQSSSSQTCELEINGEKVIRNITYSNADGCIIAAPIPAEAKYRVIYKNYPPLEWWELR